ncbi:hypothetical protein VM1G_11640 [Cytospora mali]|uniref:Uncharacterized protein n=1 Tax=Cytospora mali TaxID=578113 RepID=A0A194VZZ3_CYTMA|nr:hypothetical protein VM1G_11640 [Valsa mali]
MVAFGFARAAWHAQVWLVHVKALEGLRHFISAAEAPESGMTGNGAGNNIVCMCGRAASGPHSHLGATAVGNKGTQSGRNIGCDS